MKKYSVDRFEGALAVLIGEEETLSLPKVSLPKGLREGDILLWDGESYQPDAALAEKNREESKRLIDDLFV